MAAALFCSPPNEPRAARGWQAPHLRHCHCVGLSPCLCLSQRRSQMDFTEWLQIDASGEASGRQASSVSLAIQSPARDEHDHAEADSHKPRRSKRRKSPSASVSERRHIGRADGHDQGPDSSASERDHPSLLDGPTPEAVRSQFEHRLCLLMNWKSHKIRRVHRRCNCSLL